MTVATTAMAAAVAGLIAAGTAVLPQLGVGIVLVAAAGAWIAYTGTFVAARPPRHDAADRLSAFRRRDRGRIRARAAEADRFVPTS